MKRSLTLLLLLLCLLTLAACHPHGENDGWDTEKPYFTGRVTEVYENSCLLEVTDTGNGNFWVGDKVQVYTKISGCPAYDVGDLLQISFDGKVALSYPPQVGSALAIRRVDSDGNPMG